MKRDALERELARRAKHGHKPTTVAGMSVALLAIGYKMDRSMDCRSDNLHVSGENAGESYPAVNVGVVEADTGLSFANIDARKDDNFHALQSLRYNEELFAVVRGRILEI